MLESYYYPVVVSAALLRRAVPKTDAFASSIAIWGEWLVSTVAAEAARGFDGAREL